MRPPGFFIALYQRRIAAVQKQDLVRHLLRFPVFQNLLQLRQLLSAADIDAQCHFLMGCRLLHDQFYKCLHQGDRQIVHTVKAMILQHFESRGFSGSRHSRHDYQSHLFSPFLKTHPEALLPVPAPHQTALSPFPVPVCTEKGYLQRWHDPG